MEQPYNLLCMSLLFIYIPSLIFLKKLISLKYEYIIQIIDKQSFKWALVMSFHDPLKTYIKHSNQYVVPPFHN